MGESGENMVAEEAGWHCEYGEFSLRVSVLDEGSGKLF